MNPDVSQVLGVLFLLASVLMLFELRDTRRPASCPHCAHCAQVEAQRQREEHELTEEYARSHGLRDPDDHQTV